MTLDLGQGQELESAHDRALQAGAVRAHVLDVRDEFAREFLLPVLQAGALVSTDASLAMPLAHALIGWKLAEIATIEEATAVAHHADGPGRIRMENGVRALNPALRTLACEPAPGPDATRTAPAETARPPQASDIGADVEIAFERGVPKAVNGVQLDLTELIESLATIAGRQGVSGVAAQSAAPRRFDQLPAASVLHDAHDALEAIVVAGELRRLKGQLCATYAQLVEEGYWFTPQREAVDAFNAVVQREVTGAVRIHLHRGDSTVLGIHDSRSGIGSAARSDAQESRIPDSGVAVPAP
jgi:argininosuccinate synthase